MARKKLNVSIIEWTDAATDHGWSTEAVAVEEVTSIGWVIHESDTHLTLAADVGTVPPAPGDMTNRRIAIPKSWIKKVTVI